MTEEELQKRKNLLLGGSAAVGGCVLFIVLFSVFGVEPSGLTSALTAGLLVAAASAFGQAARIKRDARRRNS